MKLVATGGNRDCRDCRGVGSAITCRSSLQGDSFGAKGMFQKPFDLSRIPVMIIEPFLIMGTWYRESTAAQSS